jgi:hypothetical protein
MKGEWAISNRLEVLHGRECGAAGGGGGGRG